MLVRDVYDFMNQVAPFDLAMDFDNVGILVGDEKNEVKNILVALDITKDVIYEAVNVEANLIITHHPVIFKSLNKLSSDSVPYLLAKNNLNVISAHTNLDIAKGGVNTCLAEKLDLKNEEYMPGFGIIGELKENLNTYDFAKFVKEKLLCDGLRYINIDKKISKVAVCSGSGGDLANKVHKLGADAFVTGEIKHHEILMAVDLGLVVIDAGHFKTENVVIEPLVRKLKTKFNNIKIYSSNKCTDNIKYV